MTEFVYRASGHPIGFVHEKFIYDIEGHPIGQLAGTHVYTLPGAYVGELENGMVLDKHLGNPGAIGSHGNPGAIGSPGNPGIRPESTHGYADMSGKLGRA